jgi:hypothetical protein
LTVAHIGEARGEIKRKAERISRPVGAVCAQPENKSHRVASLRQGNATRVAAEMHAALDFLTFHPYIPS